MARVHHPRPGHTGRASIGRRTLVFTDGVAPLQGPASPWRRAGYQVTADEAPKGIEDMTVPELRERAREQGVDVPSKATRPTIIEALLSQGRRDEGEPGGDDA